MAGAVSLHVDHVLVTVRLTPNARDDRIETEKALSDGRRVLAARVRAVPENGMANKALEILLAKAAGVAKSRATVVLGHTQRIKVVRIDGDAAAVAEALTGRPRQR